MAKKAILFPGQGAQKVGMGKDFYDKFSVSRQIMDSASDILGWDLPKVCFEGPEEELNRTARSQPAMMVVSLAMLEAVKESQPEFIENIEAAAGLSLGEYSALVAAGVLKFQDAVKLVDKRGRFMEQSCKECPGGMVSVLGLEPDAVREICSEAGEAVAANFNSPGQVVVSGSEEGLKRVSILAKERGAKRALPLKVEGAFHSHHMKSAGEKLAAELETVHFGKPLFTVIANATAGPVESADEIRQALAAQVTSSVLWQQSMERLVREGFDTFYEVGAGNVLAGLMRRTSSESKVTSINSVEALEALAD